jgi:amino acid adenylation domain-containing protein
MPVASDQPEKRSETPEGQITGTGLRTTEDFLTFLRSLSIEVRATDGKLLLNAPAGALTPELQSELRFRKPQLLAYFSEEASHDKDTAPLTFAQQRLWLIDRFTPGTIAYNVPQSWRVRSDVNRVAFLQSLKKLAQRHSVLRTRIEMRHGEPVQVILKDVEIPADFTDLSREPDPDSREIQLQALLVELGRKQISLDHAPLIRFHVIRLAPAYSVIFYCVHHIIVDQWSLDILKRDLALLYEEATSAKPSNLPLLAVQYAEIARQERSEATERKYLGKLQYWRDRLDGIPTLLELPFSKARPAQPAYFGETLRLPFDRSLVAAVRQLAIRTNTSLYSLVFVIFATLIYRYTGQKNFCIGTPTTGRKQREQEDIVGLFVNMLPVRWIIDPSETFIQLLDRMRSSILEDLDHSDIPFQRLVTELQGQRSSSHSPLFQISFALNPKTLNQDQQSEHQQETFIGASKFDLTLQVAEHGETMDAHFEYRTDLFEKADIEKFATRFFRLAESILKEPGQVISKLSFLSTSDVEFIHTINETQLQFDRKETLVSLLDRQVTSTPEATALYCGEVTWSYRELNHRATLLASALQFAGVAPETFVAICLDRGPQLIVAILAVLKTGAAYLPLDPRYPADRVAYMLDDSGAKVLLASRTDLVQTLASTRVGLIVVDPNELNLDHPSFHQRESTPESAAYLIYTSGSTGKPKGVVVEHRNAVALLAWARNFFATTSLRGMLASTSVCFDLSIFEIFLPLVTGNSIILVDDLLALPRNPHAHRVTLINTVPSAMNALLQNGLPENLQTVCLAGELLTRDLVDRVYTAGAREVIDLYGPTETTTYSTAALRRPQSAGTIGQPIANTRIFLVDENLELLPPGLPGEILIGGEGVTRGYLGKAELTLEKFLILPHIAPSGRLYRTGDLAQLRDDGMLVYLGRRDQQIKLRGHRIELGEIETVLRETTGATQAAVVVRKGPAGDTLAGFLILPYPETFDPTECANSLRRKLPAYMIPSSLSCIARMPLTPNGKIDRNILAQRTEDEPTRENQLPHDLLEQWIANIWSARLGRKNVARDAHFFDELGGHSLVAFEIFNEIENRLGIAMMLATLFQTPTIESLADAIRRYNWKQPKSLRLLQPGFGEHVTYLIGSDATITTPKIADKGIRLMRVNSADFPHQLENIASEIGAFEDKNTSLLLVAHKHDLPHAQLLAEKLASRGFRRVSVVQ